MDETAMIVMGIFIVLALGGYVVVWFFFPEWVGMSTNNKDSNKNSNNDT